MEPSARGEESRQGDGHGAPRFPVVGIGASAGGLEAFREFLKAVPPDAGMAFVLIQHLAPSHQSLMAELLGRHTTMPVVEVEDRMAIEPNSVYVIPPNQYMSVTDGELRLEKPPTERIARAPIDFFFSSLAAIYAEKSIGVLLSGGGTDGTAGLRDIKASGGLIIVQDPETAEHDSMPRHAVDTGLVDMVLPVSDIPGALVEYARHPYVSGEREALDKAVGDPLTEIIALLRARSRFDFRQYKRSTLGRRVQRRMGLNQITDPSDYLDMLRSSPQEVVRLSRELLIGVSGFFRDPDAYGVLEERAVPALFEGKGPDANVRVWVAGCATGEEAYSIGVLLLEHKRRTGAQCGIQIFATDVDEGALAVGRTGIYLASSLAELSEKRIQQFFTRQDDLHFRVANDLRELVIFAPQNVLIDPPFSRLDLVSCRNLMIYLTAEPQKRLLDLFHFALRRGGYLFLGPAESVAGKEDVFEPVSGKWRLYRRIGQVRLHDLDFPTGTLYKPGVPARDGREAGKPARLPNISEQIQRVLVEEFAPACVLINSSYEILYAHGPVERYLDWPAGEPTQNLLEVLGQTLRRRVRGAIARAVGEDRRITQAPVPLGDVAADGAVRVTTAPVETVGGEDCFLVTFERTPGGPGEPEEEQQPASDALQLEEQLRTTREDLQSTIEELETSNEELKAANEEVMSMNEELQSTNEELETSKEELQSLNEELTAVNSQLEEKVGELERANDDLANLLRSTDIATIFLDGQMNVRRFTPAATAVFKLIASDAGRPLADVAWEVDDPALLNDARRVLEHLAPIRKEVVSKDRSHWFQREVLPYRTAEDRIGGVVVTYVDVTARKEADRLLRDKEEQLRLALEGARMGSWDRDLRTGAATWSPRLYALLGRDPQGGITRETFLQYLHEDDLPRVRRNFEKVLREDDQFYDEFRIVRQDGEARWLAASARVTRDAAGEPVRMSGVCWDITERKHDEEMQRHRQEELERRVAERTVELTRRTAELEDTARALTRAEERERQRIAQILHNDLQQILAYAKLRAHSLASEADGEAGLSEPVQDVLRSLSEAIETTRSLSSELDSGVGSPGGLGGSLRALVERIGQRFAIDVATAIDLGSDVCVAEESRLFAIRAVSELLFNCAKHAGVRRARLTAQSAGGSLVVAVEDEGTGFDPVRLDEAEGNHLSFGLRTIRQRARLLGGDLEVNSSPGAGTRCVLRLPTIPEGDND